MLKKIISISLLISGVFFFNAQIQLKGSVEEVNSRESVVGALVYILKTDSTATEFKTMTEENGNFHFPNIPLQEFLVKVKFKNTMQIIPVKTKQTKETIYLQNIELYIRNKN